MRYTTLVEGYLRITTDDTSIDHASSSVVYIEDNDVRVIVDPGSDRQRLRDALTAHDIDPKTINYVVLTHGHVDHFLLAGLFENAHFIESGYQYQWDGTFFTAGEGIPNTTIRIVPTPGHTDTHYSVLFETDDGEHVVVAGDLFFWPDGTSIEPTVEALMALEDPYALDHDALLASRTSVLAHATTIIPGHGAPLTLTR